MCRFLTMPLALILLGWYGAGASPSVTHAAPPAVQFSISPAMYDPQKPVTAAYFIIDATTGEQINDAVRVTNTGTASGSAWLYAVDAATGANGGTIFVDKTAPRQDVALWMTLQAQSVTLAPGHSQIISFQANIPRDAWAGQHLGGIVAENQSTSQNGTGPIQINIRQVAIVALQLNIAGQVEEKLTVDGASVGGAFQQQSLTLTIHNTGGTLLKPKGSLTIVQLGGKVLQQIPVVINTIVAHSSFQYPVYLVSPALKEGNYIGQLDLTYGQAPYTLHYETPFTITAQSLTALFGPRAAQQFSSADDQTTLWLLLFIGEISVLIIIAGGLLVYWKRRKRRHQMLALQYVAKRRPPADRSTMSLRYRNQR